MPHQFKDKGVPEQILKCVTEHLKDDLSSRERSGIYWFKLRTHRRPSLFSLSLSAAITEPMKWTSSSIPGPSGKVKRIQTMSLQ